MNIRSYIWLLPFFSFLGGYYLLRTLCSIESISAPDLVGQKIHTALSLLSSHNLNPRVAAYKEDPELPEGTIISQTPGPQQLVKPHQSIFLVVSSHPERQLMPSLIGLDQAEAQKILKKNKIPYKIYPVMSSSISGTCVAQNPLEHEPIMQQHVTIYFAAHTKKPILMPNFKNRNVAEVMAFLKPHQISVDIMHMQQPAAHHHCSNCVIIDQRPLAGSLMRFYEKKEIIQLKVG